MPLISALLNRSIIGYSQPELQKAPCCESEFINSFFGLEDGSMIKHHWKIDQTFSNIFQYLAFSSTYTLQLFVFLSICFRGQSLMP